MSGSDIGSYLLGASIAKSGAETRARMEIDKLKREHEAEIASWRTELDAVVSVSHQRAMMLEGRGRIRDAMVAEAEALVEAASRGPVNKAQIAALMPVSLDDKKRWALAAEGWRAEAKRIIGVAPHREAMVKADLATLESYLPK